MPKAVEERSSFLHFRWQLESAKKELERLTSTWDVPERECLALNAT
jgi:hypothetical protein